MRNESEKLDSEELMHLAMHAENHEQAISYLKRVLEMSDDNGKAYYLLGAIHAEIGMYERATEEMTRAVELEPDLPTAHFQLGLLHITSGRVTEAENAWRSLDELGDTDPLFLFKRGMLHLVNDEFDDCIKDLNQGIALNSQNEALNNDMRKVISKAEQVIKPASPSSELDKEESGSDGGHHILLAAYQRDDDTEH
ncbi:tetratricopeptide repeat protein [Candidatus Thiodiazotropha sp. CDECU1]|uniref:tetratricopeptide repeat protein n=1 Tax=Candidatus Thiodiazotropha sp. CDECU1 TaxID=3065865 RepID=UPI002930842F|nr:tetratricopeptide repeat protein [Candidatus Thiodiazotropha sp. CDECU1]